jgi:flagellar motor switch protein FliN/FliY
MSDGALSQEEIDALLGGNIEPGSGGAAANAGDKQVLESFLTSIAKDFAGNLSTLTGEQVSVSGPVVESLDRDGILQKLPETVTVVKADFTAGFPGEHIFIMGEPEAKRIASLINKEEDIPLDGVALSGIGEVVSQLSGTLVTALSGKTGNSAVAVMSPETSNVPKAVAALPAGAFFVATWQSDLANGTTVPIWEIFGQQTGEAIAEAIRKASGGRSPGRDAFTQGPGSQPGGGASVQSVQFPNLSPVNGYGEQGNINLLLDVYMEMTVELGRTKKLVKEILSMGEGTIIELDKLAGEPVDILVNRKLIAKGEVVVIDENFGVRVTEIVSPMERMSELG